MLVIGLQIHHTHNLKRIHTIYCIHSVSNKLLEITLSDQSNTIKYIDKFTGYNWIPNNEIIIPDIIPGSTIYKSNVFEFTESTYNINLDHFSPTARYKEKRPIWLFVGPSGAGKSFIANQVANSMSVYETDVDLVLPDVIIHDIIVIGNRFNHTVDNVKAKCVNHMENMNEYIIVKFDS